jgi:uncharacterized protein (DUF736 family)
MPVIGAFSAVKDGYAGTIRTLTLNIKVQLIANDRREADGAPDFRIMAGPPRSVPPGRGPAGHPTRPI